MTQELVQLSRDQLRSLIRESVAETLIALGVDTDSPLEMQQDFQHLREWRLATAAVRKKGLMTVVTLLITGTCAAIWMGLRNHVN